MTESHSLRPCIGRVRAGDNQAAVDLLRRCEPTLRRAVRVRPADHRLGRVFDLMDLRQSVLAGFFVRATLEPHDLSTPEPLLKLLATGAKDKLANGQRAARRDFRGLDHGAIAGRDVGPSRELGARELSAEASDRFAVGELRRIELCREGVEWAGIAAEMGETPEALRGRYTGGVDRVAREIGLEGPVDA